MARYIDADALKERLEDFSKWCRDGRKQGVDFVLDCPLPNMPTADVVTREDYEAVIAGQETLQKYIAKIKADVAREIFEEVQKTLIFGADRMRIAELKKKYTEEKK